MIRSDGRGDIEEATVAQKDAWRAYYEMALGLTETSRKQAAKIAARVAGKGGASAEQLQALADDFVNMSKGQREAMLSMVRVEIDRALGRVGLATMDEVKDLTKRVHELEHELAEARAGGVTPAEAPPPTAEFVSESGAVDEAAPTGASGATTSPAKKAVAKKTVAKKTVATKAPAARSTAAQSAAAKSTAVKAPTKKAAATKAAATKAAAKTTAARSAAAKAARTPSTTATAGSSATSKAAPTKSAARRTGSAAGTAPAKKTARRAASKATPPSGTQTGAS